jgi:glyceraldehyde-3-phosphate dehydrogenase (NADP+)
MEMIVGGDSVDRKAKINVMNPYDGSIVDTVPAADESDVEATLSVAEAGAREMRVLPSHARTTILRKTAEAIRARAEELAVLLSREVGKTIREARTEVARCINTFAIAAEGVHWVGGETVPFDAAPGSENKTGFFMRCPAGIVVAITPFNFPLNLAAHKVAPAIAAGNSVILKPASFTPLCDIEMGKILLQSGMPPKALSVITGSGETVGMRLVRDPRPRIVSFTGSVEVGRKIMLAGGLKKYIMELGSNSPVIIMPDADLDLAVKKIRVGGFTLAGQVCISVQRLIVHQSIRKEFTARLLESVSTLTVGDPLDEKTDVGPMITETEARRAEQWCNEAIAEGAKALLPVRREASFLYPTILDEVTPQMKVFSNEAFAPLVTITPCQNLEGAIRLANSSRYGLQAGIFTSNISSALKAAKEIDAGGIMINEIPTYRTDLMPYGGMKDSGVGREGLKQAIEEMTEIKLVCINL